MKRTAILSVLTFLLATALHAASWTGWITDEHCGEKGAAASHKSCALKCAGKGIALVFYNSADKKLYKIDNQELAKKHIGSEVVVNGEADGDSIKVASIEDSKPAK
jgi:hypothetical protein